MRSRHSFGANASACKARAGTAEAHVRLARSPSEAHLLDDNEVAISKYRQCVSMPPTRHTCFTRQENAEMVDSLFVHHLDYTTLFTSPSSQISIYIGTLDTRSIYSSIEFLQWWTVITQ